MWSYGLMSVHQKIRATSWACCSCLMLACSYNFPIKQSTENILKTDNKGIYDYPETDESTKVLMIPWAKVNYELT